MVISADRPQILADRRKKRRPQTHKLIDKDPNSTLEL